MILLYYYYNMVVLNLHIGVDKRVISWKGVLKVDSGPRKK